ncbi:hypothetical protein LCGC14_2549200, partial [marine sediment metagenome]
MPDRVRAPIPGLAEPETGSKLAQPHRVPWYWRLFGLYGRQSRPVSASGDDTGDMQRLLQDWFSNYLSLVRDRKERYRIFSEMDTFGSVSGILDVYAEESTQRDYDRGVSVWIESKDTKMISRGNECLRNVQMEDRITNLVRRFCKLGDAMQRLIYQTGKGVVAWK